MANSTHSASAREQQQPYCLHFSWSKLSSTTIVDVSCCLPVSFAAEWMQVGATVPSTVCSSPSLIQTGLRLGPYLAACFARITEYQPVG